MILCVMSMPVYLTTTAFVVVLVLSIIYFTNLGSMVQSCPWSRLVVKKSNLRLKLMLLTLIWCICSPVLRLMTFLSLTPPGLCMAIFLVCLIIPLTLSTLSMAPNVLLANCPLRKNKRTIMIIVCGFLSCLLAILLLPWMLILSILYLML